MKLFFLNAGACADKNLASSFVGKSMLMAFAPKFENARTIPPLKKGGRGDFSNSLQDQKSPPPPFFQRGELPRRNVWQHHSASGNEHRCHVELHKPFGTRGAARPDSIPTQRVGTRLTRAICASVFSAALLLTGVSYAAEPAPAPEQATAPGNSIKITKELYENLGVTLGTLEGVSEIPVLTAPAKVMIPPTAEYVVSSSQPGLVSKLQVAVGDSVKEGEVVAELDSPDLLSMQRMYLKSLTDSNLWGFAYRRDKKLLEEGAIAERRWQETQSQYNAYLADADERKQLLKIAGMTEAEVKKLASSHQLTSQLKLHAPITGVVLERMAVAGERVNSQAPIYRIGNLEELWLDIAIPQERLGDVKIGDDVFVENSKVSARIALLGQSVNPENQTVLARAVIPKNGHDNTVRPGQRVNIQIMQASSQSLFKVPNGAIAQNEGKAYLFVRTPEGFMVTPISVIGKQAEESIITGSLTGSEEIAFKGAVALKANWLGLGGE